MVETRKMTSTPSLLPPSLRRALAIGATALLGLSAPAWAQDRNAPVTFTADDVQYDREAGVVTATGSVEAWQNDRTLRADKIVFDRNTGIAAATGHVVLQEADGQVVFSDYAELTQDMKDGVLSGMRALLSQNGRLAANGARRTDAKVNELTRAIYSTCNLCAQDPTSAPLWDIRAREAIQDVEHKRIEYRDAVVDIYGIPVIYLPYLAHPDPTQKRASGLLVPSFGYGNKHLGTFATLPYYVVIDDSSDVTVTPWITSQAGQAAFFDYRKRFNFGTTKVNASIANERGTFNGHIFAKGQFVLNDVWRYGFDINRATNATYVRDYRIAPAAYFLSSSLYVEGFGKGSWSKTNFSDYQSLTSVNYAGRLPFVLPRTQYSYLAERDALGGYLRVDTGAFNLLRDNGSNTKRADLRLDWERRFLGPIGDAWKLNLNVDSATYSSHGLTRIPSYSPISAATASQAMPTASLEFRYPLVRSAGERWGTQTVEPIAKLMVSPRGSSYRDGRISNEDSLDVDFTDAILFARNHAQGIDRLEGGIRLATALRGEWNFPAGARIEGLVGQSRHAQKDPYFAATSGLRDTVSDIVARQSFSPGPYLDITARERFDKKSFQTRFADLTFATGYRGVNMNAGYLWSNTSPYRLYDDVPNSPTAIAATTTPRNEVSLGASAKYNSWRVAGTVRRDLRLNKFVGFEASTAYEDECFIFDVRFYKRYTSVLNDNGDTGVQFNITLKTVGEFGFKAY
jgi:LPS-assembly protein